MRCSFLLVLLFFGITATAQNDISIGHTESLYSELMQEERKLDIHLPQNYDTTKKTYPVLYLLDSYYNFKHVVGTVEYLILNRKIPDLIIVGIRNTNRARDLTPDASEIGEYHQKRLGTTAGADAFLSFIEKELIPHIEKNYRASPYRILEGHSLGGLFSVYTIFQKPELFSSHVIISPSLWYTNKTIEQALEDVFPDPAPLKNTSYYVSLATENGGTMRGNIYKLNGEFANYSNAHKDANIRYKYESMPLESHGSLGLPSTFFGLRYIFEPTQYEVPSTPEAIKAQGGPQQALTKTLAYFDQLSEQYGFEVTNEYALIDLGYKFIKIEEYKPYAVEVFTENVKAHPNSFDAHSTLGMAYEEMDDLLKAKEHYEKALELVLATGDPEWTFYQIDLDNINQKIANQKK